MNVIRYSQKNSVLEVLVITSTKPLLPWLGEIPKELMMSSMEIYAI